MSKPVALIILDGWGLRAMEEGNATRLADTPNMSAWMKRYERAVLDASGEAVGLPEGQMGNSEVGHLNIGAGRVVYQDITRIDKTIREGRLAEVGPLADSLKHVSSSINKLHLIGLLGSGGVHSHDRHLYALLRLAKANQVNPILHLITDGRDTPPQSALGFVKELEAFMAEENVGTIASVSGRYYAMDRDKRWERTEQAYQTIVNQRSVSEPFPSAAAVIEASYAEDITDEFILPATVQNEKIVKVEPGDVLLFTNFRADRMRQIVRSLTDPSFNRFETRQIKDLSLLSMTRYAEDLPTTVLFPEQQLKNCLAETISGVGLTQLHAAETEKYPHVTFFFNGGVEQPFAGEERILEPSPKVATYDLQPEMNALPLTEKVLTYINREKPSFILINYANPDMVGHTGSIEAAIKAVETVDQCAGMVVDAVLAQGGIALVTADHGNCERMVEHLTGAPHTYHTTNPVPFLAIGTDYIALEPRGKLADIAPTVLDLLEIEPPAEMTGRSLIQRA